MSICNSFDAFPGCLKRVVAFSPSGCAGGSGFQGIAVLRDGSPPPELAALRRMPGRRAPALALLLLRDQAQLLQGRHPVVDADLLGDQIGRSRKAQVGERGAEPGRERAHLVPAAARRVHRVLEPDIRRCELINDIRVVSRVASKIRCK